MAKQSRESIITELDARKIGYSDEMSYGELSALLKNAQQVEPVTEVPKAEEPKPEQPIDYTNVRCGLATIQDHERRIVLLERELQRFKNA